MFDRLCCHVTEETRIQAGNHPGSEDGEVGHREVRRRDRCPQEASCK